jgi:phosphatidylglycerophosphate synthase
MTDLVTRIDKMSDGEGRRRGVEAEREPNFLLARFERRFLPWAAGKLPRWILPDDMTAIGVLAALGVCGAYQLSNQGRGWLWVASGLLAVQWIGDSLDGTLARVRGIQRPKYGYYLDHIVDAIATAAIGLGLGLSPFMLLSIGALIVVGLTVFDLIGLGIVAVMLALLGVRVFGNLRELAKEEPSAPRR